MIKNCLNAIDEHMRLHFESGDPWHREQAQILRQYTLELKKWIHEREGRV